MVRFKGFQELTPINKALDKFFSRLQPRKLDSILIPLSEALERVAAENIISERNLPTFDRSAVDGYALKAEDTLEASQFQPRTLSLVDKDVLRDGEAKEIWTGNPLPNGADSVVMLEHTKKSKNEIDILFSLTPGANVSKKGEDVKKSEKIIESGTRLKAHHLGLLAALGINKVRVVKKPKVAILATGNELVPIGKKLKCGQVVEINSLVLSCMCIELGAEVFNLGITQDDEQKIKEKILEGLAKADILITTGGTSVGAPDLLPKTIEQIEPYSTVIHGIAMRPGMPTALAIVQEKPLIILSGNPVAAIIGFEVFTRPLIQELLGTKNRKRLAIKARLTRNVAGVLGRQVFLRVKVAKKGEEYLAEPIRVKGSGIITTMTKANGYVIIPEDREGIRENEAVFVHLFDVIGDIEHNV